VSNRWFVTGTDTEVGKTAICCALLTLANEKGLRTAAIKPVAAGCDENGQNSDALQLQLSMSESLRYDEINPIALQAAIAPHIAAEQEGISLEASGLTSLCRDVIKGPSEFILIEGAGGWRVPINHKETLADVAKQLRCDVIMVVGMQLGCINHALLTAEAIKRDGLHLSAWVANQPRERMVCHDENLQTLKRRLPAPLLGDVPHIAQLEPGKIARYLSIDELLR
jgi:dethiobiotin synthetase